jgi:hypothetical protein
MSDRGRYAGNYFGKVTAGAGRATTRLFQLVKWETLGRLRAAFLFPGVPKRFGCLRSYRVGWPNPTAPRQPPWYGYLCRKSSCFRYFISVPHSGHRHVNGSLSLWSGTICLRPLFGGKSLAQSGLRHLSIWTGKQELKLIVTCLDHPPGISGPVGVLPAPTGPDPSAQPGEAAGLVPTYQWRGHSVVAGRRRR